MVATTAAIVAVFVPVAFMPGIPGQFFREFGLTVSVAVVFSLVVARTADAIARPLSCCATATHRTVAAAPSPAAIRRCCGCA